MLFSPDGWIVAKIYISLFFIEFGQTYANLPFRYMNVYCDLVKEAYKIRLLYYIVHMLYFETIYRLQRTQNAVAYLFKRAFLQGAHDACTLASVVYFWLQREKVHLNPMKSLNTLSLGISHHMKGSTWLSSDLDARRLEDKCSQGPWLLGHFHSEFATALLNNLSQII